MKRNRAGAANLKAEVDYHGTFYGKGHTTLKRVGGFYEMHSYATGTHRLSVASTDALRLLAHWIGFQANQTL